MLFSESPIPARNKTPSHGSRVPETWECPEVLPVLLVPQFGITSETRLGYGSRDVAWGPLSHRAYVYVVGFSVAGGPSADPVIVADPLMLPETRPSRP